MLDTDACIALINNRPEAMRSRLSCLSPEEVGVSRIVAAELWFGVAHGHRGQAKTQRLYFINICGHSCHSWLKSGLNICIFLLS